MVNIKCKCGSSNLFAEAKGAQTGIYCADCGKWIKWATKEETRVITHREIQVKNTDSDLMEKINKAIEEIENLSCATGDFSYGNGLEKAVDILKKHIGGEVEEHEHDYRAD